MNVSNDDDRYIAYLQREMMPAGWEDCFDPSRWTKYLVEIETTLRGARVGDHKLDEEMLQRILRAHRELEDPGIIRKIPQTETIFRPIFERVQDAAREIGLNLKRDVRLVASTDICSSPAARPSDGEHLLFIGLGTSSFCNYWAKAFASISTTIPVINGLDRITDRDEVLKVLRANPAVIWLIARLGLRYAVYGSLINFGVVEQSEIALPIRIELLHAMETFVVAHEFAHFLAQENFPAWNGVIDPEESRKLEFFCDNIGIQLARACSVKERNYSSFVGVGALLNFRAIEFCKRVEAMLIASAGGSQSSRAETDDSHPPIQERIDAIKHIIKKTSEDDERELAIAYFEEFDLIIQSTLDESTVLLNRANETHVPSA